MRRKSKVSGVTYSEGDRVLCIKTVVFRNSKTKIVTLTHSEGEVITIPKIAVDYFNNPLAKKKYKPISLKHLEIIK